MDCRLNSSIPLAQHGRVETISAEPSPGLLAGGTVLACKEQVDAGCDATREKDDHVGAVILQSRM